MCVVKFILDNEKGGRRRNEERGQARLHARYIPRRDVLDVHVIG